MNLDDEFIVPLGGLLSGTSVPSLDASVSFDTATPPFPEIPHGSLKREDKQEKCIKCQTLTRHIVYTFNVSCNDGTGRKKRTFIINKCFHCNTEHSPCRECCKKAGKKSNADYSAACSKTFMWRTNNSAAAKYSMKCDVCKQGYVRCDGCQALYKSYPGVRGHRTVDTCRYLKFLKKSKEKSRYRKKNKRPDHLPSSDRSKYARTGHGPDSTGTVDPDLPDPQTKTASTTAGSPRKANVPTTIASQLETEAGRLIEEAKQKGKQLIEEANHKAKQLMREAEQKAGQMRTWANNLQVEASINHKFSNLRVDNNV